MPASLASPETPGAARSTALQVSRRVVALRFRGPPGYRPTPAVGLPSWLPPGQLDYGTAGLSSDMRCSCNALSASNHITAYALPRSAKVQDVARVRRGAPKPRAAASRPTRCV